MSKDNSSLLIFFSSNALCVSSAWPLAGQWWQYSLVSKSNSYSQSLWSAMTYCHYFIHGEHLDFCSNSQLWKEMLKHISFSFTVGCRQSHDKMRFSFLILSNPSSISQKLPATCQHSLPLFLVLEKKGVRANLDICDSDNLDEWEEGEMLNLEFLWICYVECQ